jgi:hypothetical protein
VIPHNIDPQRFQSLLAYGIDGKDVMQFFRECKAALIGVAVKVDNPPPNPAAARKVITGFSAKAHRIFGKWLIARPFPGKKPMTPDELAARLRAVEAGEEIDEAEQKNLHEIGLRELYAEQPAAPWIEFLRTRIGGESKEPNHIKSHDWIELAQWWLGDGAQPTNGKIVAAVAALRTAVDQRDADLLPEMPAFDGATEKLREAILRASYDEEVLPVERGVTAVGPPQRDYDPDVDYTDLAVIATNRSPKSTDPFFVTAEAFVDDSGKVFGLSPSDMRRALPRDGRIVLFKDRGFPTAPTMGECFVYGVQAYETEMPVKVKAVESIPDRLLRVVHIPVTSKEAHKIRDAIDKYARSPGARLAIFVTLDKVCLRPRGDAIQSVLVHGFDWQLERWDSLNAVELANGAYVVAPLPGTDKGLDCSPLSSAARRLLKAFIQRSDIKVSKAQREVLQDLVSSDELNFEESTRERLLSNINAIDRGTEDYEALVSDLLQSGPIKADIEARIVQRVDALAAERTRELQSLENLRREKANLDKGIERLRDDADKKAKAVRIAIQRAFANTSSKELESLGQIAVFEALLTRRGEISQVLARETESQPRMLWGQTIKPSATALGDIFREFGLQAESATRVERAVHLAVRLGLPIVTTGAGAFLLGPRLAASLCTEACIQGDVVIGLLGQLNVTNKLSEVGADSVLLRNANLSDLNVYASDLLALMFQQSIEKTQSGKAIKIILTTTTGAASLSLPEDVTRLAVSLDLLAIEASLAESTVKSDRGENGLWRRLSAKVEELEYADSHVTRTFADLQSLMKSTSV